jgi:hypothetical protein
VVPACEDPCRDRDGRVVAGVGDDRGVLPFTVGRMIPSKTTEDLLLGMWALLQALGRVPRG